MKSRYQLMKPSNEKNSMGNEYPDVMTFPIEKFKFVDKPREHIITEPERDRFYFVCYREYGVAYYDDIVLWLNNIDSLHNIEPGLTVLLPSKRDMDKFFIRNMQ